MNLFKYLFPPLCIACGREGRYACKICTNRFERILPRCPLCHKLSNRSEIHNECKEDFIIKYGFDIERVTSIWRYCDLSSKLLSKAKYSGVYKLYEELTNLAVEEMKSSTTQINIDNSIIIPVPSHRWRVLERGFDHTHIISEMIADRFKVELFSKVVTKTRNNMRQLEVSKFKRVSNVAGVYKVLHNNIGTIRGNASVILIDDVITTGSTIFECAKTVKQYREDLQISCLSLFSGYTTHSSSERKLSKLFAITPE